MSWTLTTSGAAIIKAGANVNADIKISGSFLAKWSDQSEASLSAITRKDWVADYNSVDANFRAILDDTVSDMIAMKMIAYDMSGYTSRLEAATVLDFLRDNMSRNIGVLTKDENKEVML